jgi:hypothetical protein
MPMTSTLPRRPSLMTIPALANRATDAQPASIIAPDPIKSRADGKTGPFFYAILSFIILALVLGVFPPA